MSITLSIPPAIVQEVREWAEANGTSLNQYVRDCLEANVRDIQAMRKTRGEEFRAFSRANLAHAPRGWKFSRERDGVREQRAFA